MYRRRVCLFVPTGSSTARGAVCLGAGNAHPNATRTPYRTRSFVSWYWFRAKRPSTASTAGLLLWDDAPLHLVLQNAPRSLKSACRTSTSRGPFSARPRSAPPSSSSAGQGLATGPTRHSHAIHGVRLPDLHARLRSGCLVAFSCTQLTSLSQRVPPQLEAAHATVMKSAISTRCC